MILWIALAYAAVALLLVRPLAGHFAWWFCHQLPAKHHSRRHPDGAQWFGASTLALVLASVWPICACWWLASWGLPAVGAERSERIQQQAARIADLERQLEES